MAHAIDRGAGDRGAVLFDGVFVVCGERETDGADAGGEAVGVAVFNRECGVWVLAVECCDLWELGEEEWRG